MNKEPYIIGGQDADENEWPWQVRFNEKRSVKALRHLLCVKWITLGPAYNE